MRSGSIGRLMAADAAVTLTAACTSGLNRTKKD